ncbi:MAG: ATP-binding cassette domain-containing protein [Acidobacteria bacterium]|nr:ATP-binding cassette domain-containing protein [Acidobacteriota bacterium]
MLKASGIVRRATDGQLLLDEVSLELAPGDRLALTGPSGSGKSLLLRALVVLDPLDAGRIEWRGEIPAGNRVPAYRRRVIYLQQAPWIFEGDVETQLAIPWTFGTTQEESFDRAQAERLLERTGRSAAFLAQEGSNLSGGEAQLVALVRALLLEPSVLLLDEPTSAMDQATKSAAEALLEEWIEGIADRAWIWVSHDAAQLARTCRRRLELENGRSRT